MRASKPNKFNLAVKLHWTYSGDNSLRVCHYKHITHCHLMHCYYKNIDCRRFRETPAPTTTKQGRILKKGPVFSSISSAAQALLLLCEINCLLLSVSVVIIRPLQHFWPCSITVTAVCNLRLHSSTGWYTVSQDPNSLTLWEYMKMI